MIRRDQWKRQLGASIRAFRINQGWTQEELAQHLREGGFQRCSRSLLSQIEAGVATIRGYEIYYLRQIFGESFEREFWGPFHNCESRKGSKEGGA